MKSVRFAYAVFAILVISVFINCFLISRTLDGICELILSAEEKDMALAKADYGEIFEKYNRRRLFIGLSVDHNDLSDIENAFSEIIGAADAGDSNAVMAAKSRLINRLRHIRRLSGINIESIF